MLPDHTTYHFCDQRTASTTERAILAVSVSQHRTNNLNSEFLLFAFIVLDILSTTAVDTTFKGVCVIHEVQHPDRN